jgi:6-phosphofructokinase 1
MRIGVMCSGGDSPGMNPCIRGVVRTALAAGHEVVGIRRGYQGILSEDFHGGAQGDHLMTLRSVSGLSMEGGTILYSSRCPEFREAEAQKRAAANLKKHGIDALIPIGGNGTLRGAIELRRHWDGQIVGCPGTIDNDLKGTDYTIGFATAVQTAVEAVDKLRDTATSHDRMFLVEVMGRHSGYIALHTALAAGAELACIPEIPFTIPEIAERLTAMRDLGKTSLIMIVAEGVQGGVHALDAALSKHGCPFATRSIALGHLQRGGAPAPADRILGAHLGSHAVEAVLRGSNGVMLGVMGDDPVQILLEDAVEGHREVPRELVDLLSVLAS